VVACGRDGIPPQSRIFAGEDGYERTILLVPTAQRARFDALAKAAEVIYVGEADDDALDLATAMKELRAHGVISVLCEGGPRLGASILAAGLVDRIYWFIAPRFLSGDEPVAVLSGADLWQVGLRFDRTERIGPDLLITGTPCSAD
jgi:diaminohydroxyphosphoribosylaminopyrimidine deaminase/5-amino-6-(5-phosphoribosylamino)uracil reductase